VSRFGKSFNNSGQCFVIGESIQLFESDRKFESQGIILKDRETEIYQQLVSQLNELYLDLIHMRFFKSGRIEGQSGVP